MELVLSHTHNCLTAAACHSVGSNFIKVYLSCCKWLTKKHVGHPGTVRTKASARMHVWWLNLDKQIEFLTTARSSKSVKYMDMAKQALDSNSCGLCRDF